MSDASDSAPWYADGVRFACTQCGNCCTGPPGAVWFNDEEAHAMAAKVGVDVKTFYRRYARKLRDGWSLTELRTRHGFDCVFLQRDEARGTTACTLYEARPTQCRTWPFWPDVMESEDAWDRTRESTPCPGMGSGPVIPLESILDQLHAERNSSES